MNYSFFTWKFLFDLHSGKLREDFNNILEVLLDKKNYQLEIRLTVHFKYFIYLLLLSINSRIMDNIYKVWLCSAYITLINPMV